MLLIAIVDDERSDSSALKALVDTYFQQNRQAYMIHVFNGALDFIRSTENHDIVFMDIRMDKLDGLEVARIMRKINTDSVLIFVTHMAQLAIKGYEVDALDYVLKPVNYYQFCTKLSRAVQRVQRRRGGQVVLQLAGGGMQVLSTGDIYYLETHDRLLWYHTTKGEFSVRASLASAEKQLAQYHFSRCNQCYLVNLKYVKAVENDFVHVNTDHLEISRRQRAAFLTAVASYIGGVL